MAPGMPWNPLRGSKALSAKFGSSWFGNAFSSRRPSGSGSVESAGTSKIPSSKTFPLKAAWTAGSLALAGDTIAQVITRAKKRHEVEEEAKLLSPCCQSKKLAEAPGLYDHDFVRALRMFSYGFLFYGPGSDVWYKFLDTKLPAKTAQNFAIKVAANQVALGPAVITVVFAWNFAWMGKLSELPGKYYNDFMPTLMAGWKFWIPAALINFSVVPLPLRVAFMSGCSVFWNFYLSTTIGKKDPPQQIEEHVPKNENSIKSIAEV